MWEGEFNGWEGEFNGSKNQRIIHFARNFEQIASCYFG